MPAAATLSTSPSRKRAIDTMWLPMSANAPPASAGSQRHENGACGSAMKSSAWMPRNPVTVPISPLRTISRAVAIRGFRR